MKFTNRKIGRSECLYILTDAMDPYTLAVYELIKSFAGFECFNLSLREIAKYRNMSYGKAQQAFSKLKKSGLIVLKKKTAFFEADEYDICDEWVAYQMDPEMEYNKKRKEILDAKPAARGADHQVIYNRSSGDRPIDNTGCLKHPKIRSLV